MHDIIEFWMKVKIGTIIADEKFREKKMLPQLFCWPKVSRKRQRRQFSFKFDSKLTFLVKKCSCRKSTQSWESKFGNSCVTIQNKSIENHGMAFFFVFWEKWNVISKAKNFCLWVSNSKRETNRFFFIVKLLFSERVSTHHSWDAFCSQKGFGLI